MYLKNMTAIGLRSGRTARGPARRERWIALLMLAVSLPAALRGAQQKQDQTSTSVPGRPRSFEVASIKLDRSEGSHVRVSFDSDSMLVSGATLKRLIELAYNVNDSQLSGGPEWANSTRYEIRAKMDDETAEALKKLPVEQKQEQRRHMVQSLLADRFKLKVSKSSKELPVYALTVARKGPMLTASTNASSGIFRSPGSTRFTGVSIAAFADWLSGQVGRKVVDKTGLTEKYDFSLHWAPEKAPDVSQGPASLAADPSGPSIFTALQEQLGLKLESTRGPVQVLLIDSVERPSEN